MGCEPFRIVETGNGSTVKYNNRNLYSTRNPIQVVKKVLEALVLQEKTLYFVPSPVLGHGLLDLLDSLPAECHILSVEIDQVLMRLLCTHGPQELLSHPQITIVRTDDARHLVRILEDVGMWHFRRVRPVYLSGGYNLYRQQYDAMQLSLESALKTFWQNKRTLIAMGRLWVKNIFDNLSLLPYCASASALKSTGPILVIGAGPSLENHLATVKRAHGRALILAVDTAVPVLSEYGIVPDFIFTLESQYANIYDFITSRPAGVPLIADLSSCPAILRLFEQRIYLYSSRFFPLELFDRLSGFGLLPVPFPALGSVGVAATHAALTVTEGPVILIGLDFSYLRSQTHAKGTLHYIMMSMFASRLEPFGNMSFASIQSRPLLRLHDRKGSPILSDLVLDSYATQLAAIASASTRVFCFGQQGLPISERYVASESELWEILPRKAPTLIPAHTQQASTRQVTAFLEQECAMLERSQVLLESLLAEGRRESRVLEHNEKTILAQTAYLFVHFPDPEPLPRFDRSFFKRALLAAAYYTDRLQRAKKLVANRQEDAMGPLPQIRA